MARFECLERVNTVDLTGVRDYTNQYCYLIHDKKTGERKYIHGKALKAVLSSGTAVDNVKLTADNRIYLSKSDDSKLRVVEDTIWLAELTTLLFKDNSRGFYARQTNQPVRGLLIKNTPLKEFKNLRSRAKALGGSIIEVKTRNTVAAVVDLGNVVIITAPNIGLNTLNDTWTRRGLTRFLGVDSVTIEGIKTVSKDLSSLFFDDDCLKSIKFVNTDLSRVEKLNYTFSSYILESVEITGTTLDNVTDITGIFKGANRLQHINIPEMHGVKNAANMLSFTSNSHSLNLKWFCPDHIENLSQAFNASNFEEIDLGHLDISSVTSMRSIALNCENLKRFRIGKAKGTPLLRDMSYAFKGCKSLEVLDIGAITAEKLKKSLMECIKGPSFKDTTTGMFGGINKGVKMNIDSSLVEAIKYNEVESKQGTGRKSSRKAK